MSMAEKNRHQHPGTKVGESKAHSLAHKYDAKKMTTVVNHTHHERAQSSDGAKRAGKKAEG